MWNTTSADAEVFIATTGERFITAPDIDDGEARFSAFSNHAARLSIETAVSALKAELQERHSATFRHRRDWCHSSVFAVRPDRRVRALKFG